MIFNAAFFWRVLIAVIGAILAFAIIPPLLRIIGFPASADLMVVIKIAVAAIAIFYVLKG